MITAVYSGSGNFIGSTSPAVSQTVTMASTSTVVTADVNPSVVGTTVTFTAAVRVTPPGSGTPTGMVTFKDGTMILGTGSLDATAHATLSTSSLSVGHHAITAVYPGDSSFNGSTSKGYGQTVKSSAAIVAAPTGHADRSGTGSIVGPAFSSSADPLTDSHVSPPVSSGSGPISTEQKTVPSAFVVSSSDEARVDAFFAHTRSSARLAALSGKRANAVSDGDELAGLML
jgi:hypothetical protein